MAPLLNARERTMDWLSHFFSVLRLQAHACSRCSSFFATVL